ncbi:MAG: succinylglutamate desuccinylase/aspartoacylase family protein, partial [Chloroflexi bacterium]|nr:succinylglutamate desuccinylase/aspartoacylase family protein [Chloroflexota bacterium]
IAARGRELVSLLPGTDWAAEGIEINSGKAGPRIMVLGGVHGNEPGGWLAAESIADWQVERGSLLVLPRLNWRAASAMVRTFPELGDLNRFYPGLADGLPMQRMANAVVEVGREFEPELLFDLHESWVFYKERGANGGTAFIGQTMSLGGGATEATVDRMANVVRTVNSQISAREEIYMRGAATPRAGVPVIPSTPRPSPTAAPAGTPLPGAALGNGVTFGGRSSLSLGNWIRGCVPILIEMGQQDQPDSRRSALHQMLVRTTLEQSGML